jgi:hypothetical protein
MNNHMARDDMVITGFLTHDVIRPFPQRMAQLMTSEACRISILPVFQKCTNACFFIAVVR